VGVPCRLLWSRTRRRLAPGSAHESPARHRLTVGGAPSRLGRAAREPPATSWPPGILKPPPRSCRGSRTTARRCSMDTSEVPDEPASERRDSLDGSRTSPERLSRMDRRPPPARAADDAGEPMTAEEAFDEGLLPRPPSPEAQAARAVVVQAQWSARYYEEHPEKVRALRPDLTPGQLRHLVRKVTRIPRVRFEVLRRPTSIQPRDGGFVRRGSTRMSRPGGRRIRTLAARSSRDGPSSSSDDPSPGGQPRPFGRVDVSGILFVWRLLPLPSWLRCAVFMRLPEAVQRHGWRQVEARVALARAAELRALFGEEPS
jgi:hypothetical protein